MRARALAVGLLISPLSAFALTDAFQKQMNGWIGRTPQELLAHFESPVVAYDRDDYRMIASMSSRSGSVSTPNQREPNIQTTTLSFGTADQKGHVIHKACEVTFTGRGSVIETWHAEGERCVAEKVGPPAPVPSPATLPGTQGEFAALAANAASPPAREPPYPSVTTLAFAAFFFLLIGLGRWTRSEGGPFAALLRPLVKNIESYCQVIGYNINCAAAGVVLLYVALLEAVPNERAIYIQWWLATIIFLAALGVALGSVRLAQSGSASKQSFGLRQTVSLMLASVSAVSMGRAGDSLFRVLYRWSSDRGTIFIYSVLAAVLILVAGMVTDRKWPLVVPTVLVGVFVLYAGSLAQQFDLSVALGLLLFAFVCRGVPKRRPSDLASWVQS